MLTNIDPFLESTKNALTVVDTGETWTYGRLYEEASAIADRMLSSDQDTFYIVGGNDISNLAYMYASVLAGKTIVPVPDFAAEMITPMLAAVFGVTVDARSLPPVEESFAKPGGGNVIAFTSGTTGRPKAYAHSPNMFELPNDTNAPVEITSDCKIYCTAPLTAAPASYTISLSEGAEIGLSSSIVTDPSQIVENFNLFGANTLFTTPSLLEKIVDGLGLESMPGLERVITSSMATPYSLLAKLREQDIPVYDVYISTETGPIAYRNNSKSSEFTVYPGLGFRSEDGLLMKDGGYKAAKGVFTPAGIMPMPNTITNGDYVTLHDDKIFNISRSPMRVKVSGFSVDLDVIRHEAELVGCRDVRVTSETSAPSDVVTLRYSGQLSESDLADRLSKSLPWYYLPKVLIRD